MLTKPTFVEGEIYHIYNRGVEKRIVFLSDRDRIRFVYNLFASNGQNGLKNLERFSNKKIMDFLNTESFDENEQLVEILGFVLMPNHFHLLVQQKANEGIVRFMQKIGIAYTMFFNKKHTRIGPLFQGSFRASLVETDAHFMYILHYIHLNPLALMNKNTSIQKKMIFLEHYKWSSLPDYLGYTNFQNILNKKFFLDIFGGEKEYKEDLMGFIKQPDTVSKTSINDDLLKDILLDASN